jgi:two-component system, OmpR family, response regulator VanR
MFCRHYGEIYRIRPYQKMTGGFPIKPTQILVVDDDNEIADLVEIYLSNEGYQVLKAADGREALQIIQQHPVQLVILDIMMPHIDGLEVCRRIRKERNIPIIMLSAKSEEIDKIMGLSTGADDYVTKPFHPMELVARVKSQLRRFLFLNNQVNGSIQGQHELTLRGLYINKLNRDVRIYDQAIPLTPTEFEILYLLASNAGRVFSGEEIFERVWKEKYFESHNTVMVHIRKIREKLKKYGGEVSIIKTVWGVGYKIEN